MKLWGVTKLALGLVIILVLWFFSIGFHSNQPGSYFDKGQNAVWLESTWVKEKKSLEEIESLVKTLNENKIGTVFVHSGPFNKDGSLDNENYLALTSFLEKIRSFDENIKYQAWLGQIRGKIDLEDEEVRHEIAKQAMTLTEIVGFDGIHFDIEPVWDEDLSFVETLRETREKISANKEISVALAEFIPRSVLWTLGKFREFPNHNSEVIYRNVAEYADQIVVMVYDTDIDSPRLYRWLIAEQTVWLSRVMDEDTNLLVGIPAYEEVKEGFNPIAENVETSLTGVLRGLNNIRTKDKKVDGIAIYRFNEMSDDEWSDYANIWLK